MSVEKKGSRQESSEHITELENADKTANLGSLHELTPDNYPNLSFYDPEGFALLRLKAIGIRLSDLSKSRNMLRSDPESMSRISAQMKKGLDLASDIVKETFTETEVEVEKGPIFFYLGREESETLRIAVNRGFVEVINSKNIPSLAALPEEDLLRERLLSISNAKNNLETIVSNAKSSSGFGDKKEELTNTNDFATKEIRRLKEMSEDLSRNYLEKNEDR